jgi:uncharacterized protein YhbP (UPF0306 family)/quercetin dioxygenase-like cupin family protein
LSSEQPKVDVPPHVLDYLSEQNTLTLATASPGAVPHASTFLYVNDGPTLYFWSKPNTTTARQVEQNPVVSFAIDSYADDLRQTKGVQGTGECNVILSGEEIARVADLFGQKFPDLSPGVTMSISFFRVTPADLEFIDNTAAGAEAPEGQFGAEFHRERAYSVFDDLPTQQVGSIVASLQVTEAKEGEVIVRQGGPADKFFIVAEGEVEVEREENGSQSVATLGPGDFFGEVSILRNAPREATVKATKPTKLLAMERDTFRDLVAQSLGTTQEFDKVIQARLGAHGGGA